MSALTIAAWNLTDGLGKPEKMPAIVEQIRSMEADIMVLPEAFAEGLRHSGSQADEALAIAEEKLTQEGYTLHLKSYDDVDGRKDRHVLGFLTRFDDAVRVYDMGSRQTLGQRLGSFSLLTVVGVHLDDRSEETRHSQAGKLINQLQPQEPNVIIGDFNAMHRDDRRARLLRPFRPIVNYLPTVDPGETAPNWYAIRRPSSLFQRLTHMATGSVMTLFDERGYVDADKQTKRPTNGPVQLDHLLTNFDNVFYMAPRLLSHKVHEVQKGLSTHRPISGVVRL